MTRAATGSVALAVLLTLHGVRVHAADLSAVDGKLWTTPHYAELSKALQPGHVATGFIYRALRQAGKDKVLDLDVNRPRVMDYRFFDMRGDGHLELLCRLDFSGRGMSLYLAAIAPTSDGVQAAILNTGGAPLERLSDIVQDVNHDGRKEIVVDRPLEWGADQSRPRPHFTDIYVYQTARLTRDDAGFRRYYQDILLPKLQSGLAKDEANLKATAASDTDALETDREKIRAEKLSIAAIRQFLLQ